LKRKRYSRRSSRTEKGLVSERRNEVKNYFYGKKLKK
jgi:hypothetical protein